MRSPISLRPAAFALLMAAFAGLAFAETQTFQPSVGQDGKDVVWVPTPQVLVDTMLDMAGVSAADYVIDLGSGDGRTVITAAKRGARAVGIEYNPEMVALSKRNAEREGVAGRARFVKADLFESDFSQASVITMFLLPEINLKLRSKILGLKPGTRIVSNTFPAVGWDPDATSDEPLMGDCDIWCSALLWIVPANVAGTYETPHGHVMLNQQNQILSGVLRTGERIFPLEGRVRGEEIGVHTGEGRGDGTMWKLLRDVRLAVRALAKAPRFTGRPLMSHQGFFAGTPLSVDVDNGLVFVPTGTPS